MEKMNRMPERPLKPFIYYEKIEVDYTVFFNL